MRKSPLKPWPAGSKAKSWPFRKINASSKAWIQAVLLIAILLPGGGISSAFASPSEPIERLAVSFDLNRGALHGTSHIVAPPGQDIHVFLEDLAVSRLVLNGKDLAPGSVIDNTVLIPAAATGRDLVITYSKTFPGPPGLSGNLISPAGITLTGVWHPVLDQDALFELTAAIPADFEAVSEADTITATVSGTEKEVRFHFSHPLMGINFVAGPYVVKKAAFGQGKELYAYFFAEDQKLTDRYLQKTLSYLDRYEKLLGPYPYQRFSVVENRLPTGFAMPTFTLLGQAVVRLPFITDTSLGHEVLHSWFGNGVRIDPKNGNWAEGLTTYFADQAFARDKGEGPIFRKGQLIKYQSYVGEDNTIALKDFSGSYSHLSPMGKALRAVGYEKSSMLFRMLSQRLGNKVFLQGLRDFYTRMKYRRAGWHDLRESFEKASHASLAAFFDQWLNRSDVPHLMAKNIRVEEKDGAPRLVFTLTQRQKTPYRLDVPVRIKTPGGTISRTIRVTAQDTEVVTPLDEIPTELLVDPDYDVMRWLLPGELPPVWSRFLGAQKKLAVGPTKDGGGIFAPLLAMLKEYDCPVIAADKATDRDVADKAVIFLGLDSAIVRSLFAAPHHPAGGLTLDVLENPLGPDQVAVLVSAATKEEVALAAPKLIHYGKYSLLHFKNGRIQEKSIRPSTMGQLSVLDTPPAGIALQKTLSFDDIMARLRGQRVIYLGETHTRNEDHRLQLRVIRALYKQNPKLAIGMEMFPRSAQKLLDAYVAGDMTEWEFLKKSHYFKNWGYDYRLYRDIINFARRHKLPIVALNLPKEIVSKVFRQGGIAALTPEERGEIPTERRLDMPGYRQRIAGVFTMHNARTTKNAQVNDFFQAQALWDETMAESAARFLLAHPDYRLAMVVGQGHAAKDTGIPPRVARRVPVKQAVLLNAQERPVGPETADYLVFSPAEPLSPQPLLGVQLLETKSGVTVAALSPHGKAGASGIKKGDVILAMDDEPVGAVEDLKIIMLHKKRGESVRLRIRRQRLILPDEVLTVKVPL